jgi:hypothetical protein
MPWVVGEMQRPTSPSQARLLKTVSRADGNWQRCAVRLRLHGNGLLLHGPRHGTEEQPKRLQGAQGVAEIQTECARAQFPALQHRLVPACIPTPQHSRHTRVCMGPGHVSHNVTFNGHVKQEVARGRQADAAAQELHRQAANVCQAATTRVKHAC